MQTEDTDKLTVFGARVRVARQQAGLSQEAMAHRCRVHRTYFSAVERGERNVSLLTLLKISTGLAVDPSQLVEGLA